MKEIKIAGADDSEMVWGLRSPIPEMQLRSMLRSKLKLERRPWTDYRNTELEFCSGVLGAPELSPASIITDTHLASEFATTDIHPNLLSNSSCPAGPCTSGCSYIPDHLRSSCLPVTEW